MKKIIVILSAVVMLMALFSNESNAQCKDFTENEVMPLLDDYIISGRYNTVKLSEGDDMLVFKTLSKDINYRFIVKGDENLPKEIEFVVETWDGKVLHNSKENENNPIWDYSCNKTQRVKIYVKVPTKNPEPSSGCLTLITGIKAS